LAIEPGGSRLVLCRQALLAPVDAVQPHRMRTKRTRLRTVAESNCSCFVHLGHAMQTPLRQQRLAALRDIIADIERKPALAEARAKVEAEGGRFPILAGGLLQEVFTDDRRNAGASLGFALAQSRSLLTPQRLAVVYVQLTQEAQQLGLPYGPGLLHFGFDPDALVMVRAGSMAELLWVAEEALGCRAVAAVVGDIGKPSKVLDFTASRRLSLRAAEAGSSMFLLRYGTG